MMYSQDFDETMPQFAPANSSWRGVIQPYIKSGQIFACPSNPMKDKKELVNRSGFVWTQYPVSYAAANSTPAGSPDGLGGFSTNNNKPAALASFTAPAQCIVVVESTDSQTRYTVTNGVFNVTIDGKTYTRQRTHPPVQSTACSFTPANECNSAGALFAGHSGMSNFLFADGHAKAMKPLATVNNAAGGGTNLWNRDGSPFVPADLKNAEDNLRFSQDAFK